jgi:hypothetical protein
VLRYNEPRIEVAAGEKNDLYFDERVQKKREASWPFPNSG